MYNRKRYYSGESIARRIIQRLRPQARKHGLKGGIVDAYLRENLPKKYASATWKEMKNARDYKWIREIAEGYRPPFNPDLCEIYADDREIIMYEIEASSPVTKERIDLIKRWQGLTMDAWSWWDVIVITTNRYGFGWDVLIDTKRSSKAFALYQLRNRSEVRRKYYPDLMTVAAIEAEYEWLNWRMPTTAQFEAVRLSVERKHAGSFARKIEAWERKNRAKSQTEITA